MKRLVLCILVLFCMICAHATAEKDGPYTYQINPDNTVTITGYDWHENYGDIYIPEMLGNRIVTAIGDHAFATRGNTPVKITLPEMTRSIGAEAFRGVNITYINIPMLTTEIGGGAFAECTVRGFSVENTHPAFATIDNALYSKKTKTLLAWPENKEIAAIPDKIVGIGDYVFYGRQFTGTYKLPDSLQYIGKYAFANISGGETAANININHASQIDDYAFYKANVRITEKMSLSSIGAHAFEEAHLYYESADGRQIWHDISATPYTIGDNAFYKCCYDEYICNSKDYDPNKDDELRLINATFLGHYAFAECSHRVTVIDETTKQIQINERPVIRLDAEDLSQVTFIGEHAFYSSPIAMYGNNNTGYHAYAHLTNTSLSTISKGAFSNTGITDVVLADTVTTISETAFAYCAELSDVQLPSGLTTIQDRAFYGCKKLNAISIPASVTLIGQDVFTGCADSLVITVEAGSYGEVWARISGYSYVVNGKQDDTSWLDW